MREGTSGFWTTQKDGKITIEYVDFGVSEVIFPNNKILIGYCAFESCMCLEKLVNSENIYRCGRGVFALYIFKRNSP